MLIVNDMEQTKKFYQTVLGLHIIMDFGANITLTGGLSLQTKESYAEFIDKKENEIKLGGNDVEIYFEEDNFDAFVQKLEQFPEIQYVHPVKEHRVGPTSSSFL